MKDDKKDQNGRRQKKILNGRFQKKSKWKMKKKFKIEDDFINQTSYQGAKVLKRDEQSDTGLVGYYLSFMGEIRLYVKFYQLFNN